MKTIAIPSTNFRVEHDPKTRGVMIEPLGSFGKFYLSMDEAQALREDLARAIWKIRAQVRVDAKRKARRAGA